MFYIIAFFLMVVSYFMGKLQGESEGRSSTEATHYFLYAPQIDSYEQGFKDGERKTKEKLFVDQAKKRREKR